MLYRIYAKVVCLEPWNDYYQLLVWFHEKHLDPCGSLFSLLALPKSLFDIMNRCCMQIIMSDMLPYHLLSNVSVIVPEESLAVRYASLKGLHSKVYQCTLTII